jgi:hypothetical protein
VWIAVPAAVVLAVLSWRAVLAWQWWRPRARLLTDARAARYDTRRELLSRDPRIEMIVRVNERTIKAVPRSRGFWREAPPYAWSLLLGPVGIPNDTPKFLLSVRPREGERSKAFATGDHDFDVSCVVSLLGESDERRIAICTAILASADVRAVMMKTLAGQPDHVIITPDHIHLWVFRTDPDFEYVRELVARITALADACVAALAQNIQPTSSPNVG